MSGRVVHFEIPSDDEERATAFYRDVAPNDAPIIVVDVEDVEGNALGLWQNA